ncbi:MAG TPA: sulfite exporter TauE/SafE family protein [Thermoanaerobaculia bacterium]|nr:sulfite exporter TauE/SafE family protein [Thermoanaerobaculia bacterium]
MTPGTILALVAASVGGGLMNAMAGGGTILTFPTLLFLGLPSVSANATSTVGLLPGAAASMFGYRREVNEHRDWLRTLFLPSLLGGAVGSILLLRTPDKIFANLAPLLILFATALFMVQGFVARRAAAAKGEGDAEGDRFLTPGRWAVAALCQFGVAIYGGYFGAGIGILMLAVLGFLGLSNIHAMNGLKNFFGFCINGVAAAYFIARGAVVWPAALVLVAGSIAGGYGGARFARRIGQQKARVAVVIIGLFIAALLFWKQLRS